MKLVGLPTLRELVDQGVGKVEESQEFRPPAGRLSLAQDADRRGRAESWVKQELRSESCKDGRRFLNGRMKIKRLVIHGSIHKPSYPHSGVAIQMFGG